MKGRVLALAALVFIAGAGAAEPELSALDTARALHRHLAKGELSEAAALSNAPKRRLEVLQDYRASVGDEEFKRLFEAYLHPQTRLVAEIAHGEHHLLIWQLAGLARLAGEHYVAIDGRFRLDDVPSDARRELTRILRQYRAENPIPD
jgi:hypothetical protein